MGSEILSMTKTISAFFVRYVRNHKRLSRFVARTEKLTLPSDIPLGRTVPGFTDIDPIAILAGRSPFGFVKSERRIVDIICAGSHFVPIFFTRVDASESDPEERVVLSFMSSSSFDCDLVTSFCTECSCTSLSI